MTEIEQGLMTVQQLAEKYDVSTKTVRRWIADAEIEPEMVSTSTGGRPLLLYGIHFLDIYVQKVDVSVLKSDAAKLKFMEGHALELIKNGNWEEKHEAAAFLNSLSPGVGESLLQLTYDLAHVQCKLEQVRNNQKVILAKRLETKIRNMHKYVNPSELAARMIADTSDDEE
jgi:hypothetical protein